jgi:hypothetical protein
MDGIRELLGAVLENGLAAGHFRGLLHIAIGRKVTRPDGSVVTCGVTWRELAPLLKQLRFDRELVREVGADPDALAPRDRQRFWYSAIALARVDAPEAVAEAEKLAERLKPLGFVVGPPPSGTAPPRAAHPNPSHPKGKSAAKEKPEKAAGRNKKKG